MHYTLQKIFDIGWYRTEEYWSFIFEKYSDDIYHRLLDIECMIMSLEAEQEFLLDFLHSDSSESK